MKYVFYILCPLPTICLLISLASPDDFNGGGATILFQLGLGVIMIVSCLVLTVCGGVLIASSKNKILPSVATAIAAFPGIRILIGNFFQK